MIKIMTYRTGAGACSRAVSLARLRPRSHSLALYRRAWSHFRTLTANVRATEVLHTYPIHNALAPAAARPSIARRNKSA